MMTQERLSEIRSRLAYARSAHPRNILPQMGDLKAMEDLVDEVDRLREAETEYLRITINLWRPLLAAAKNVQLENDMESDMALMKAIAACEEEK